MLSVRLMFQYLSCTSVNLVIGEFPGPRLCTCKNLNADYIAVDPVRVPESRLHFYLGLIIKKYPAKITAIPELEVRGR